MILTYILCIMISSPFRAIRSRSFINQAKSRFTHVTRMKLITSTDTPVTADEVTAWDSTKYQWFLDNYWQKKPLLIRSAITADDAMRFSRSDLEYLVADEDVESRLVTRVGRKGKWVKSYGPFDGVEMASLPAANWTVLIQVSC